MKFLSEGAELFHSERQTDLTKLIVAFRNFADAPKTITLFVIQKERQCEVTHLNTSIFITKGGQWTVNNSI